MARLLSSLPVGAKVVDKDTKYNGVPITWLVGGHDHYTQGQTVMVSEKIISIKVFDAKEPNNTNSDRKSYGNNRYSQSNIRQWLNSDKTSWYNPQHSADSPPIDGNVWDNKNDYEKESGFLAGFREKLRNELIPTSLTVAKNTITDGGSSEIVVDKVFLLSTTEVGLGKENNIAEGEVLPLFTTANISRLAYPTAEAVEKSEYKNTDLTSTKAWRYWLRSPHAFHSAEVRAVYSSGVSYLDSPYVGVSGVRPAINLPSYTLVSNDVNSNDEYEIVRSLITPLSNTELGDITDNALILKYTPKFYDSSDTVTEKINGVVVGTKTIINDTEYTVSVTKELWDKVKYGKYKDILGNKNVVTLEDSNGIIYTYPFTKTLPITAKTNDVLLAVNDMSNTAMASHKKRLVDAIGNKATVGGTGTLEDIAKAIESISVESMDGIRYAKGNIVSYVSGSYSEATVNGLSFTPKAIVILSLGAYCGVFFPKDYKGMNVQSSSNIDIVRGSTDSQYTRLTFIATNNGFKLSASSGYFRADQNYEYIAFS